MNKQIQIWNKMFKSSSTCNRLRMLNIWLDKLYSDIHYTKIS